MRSKLPSMRSGAREGGDRVEWFSIGGWFWSIDQSGESLELSSDGPGSRPARSKPSRALVMTTATAIDRSTSSSSSLTPSKRSLRHPSSAGLRIVSGPRLADAFGADARPASCGRLLTAATTKPIDTRSGSWGGPVEGGLWTDGDRTDSDRQPGKQVTWGSGLLIPSSSSTFLPRRKANKKKKKRRDY